MSFKPLHTLMDQQQQSVVISGNRRIAPASSKPGNASISLPTSSIASLKPDQKIQLGGQIINVADLQGILKSGTNIVDLGSSQSSPQVRGKNPAQQSTYARRLQVKQQQQQQQPSNILSRIVVQDSASPFNAAAQNLQNDASSAFVSEQKPFALQMSDDAANQNRDISFVTVMESEDCSSGSLLPTTESREELIFQTEPNGIVFHGATTQPDQRKSSLVIDNASTNQPFGQIIYHQNESTGSLTSQPLYGGGGGGGGGGGEPFHVFDVNALGEEIDGPEDNSFHHDAGQPSVSDQEATTTVLIPSSMPGGEPQRLVIPTSTLLQITGQSSSSSSSSAPSSISVLGAPGLLPKSGGVQSHIGLQQRSKPATEQDIAAGFLDQASPFLVSPAKNSNIVLLPKPSLATPNGGRYVPITAALTHSIDSITTQDSFELNGTTSPLKDSTQRFATSPVNPSPAEAGANRNRKPCNCTKSQCLKLYCDCFANGEFCFFCNCNGCMNNIDNEEARQKSIKQCLDRNPYAFHPKIGKSKANGGETRRHAKGCNCKKSGCLKNYCECYEAKIPCTSHCKCVGCKNFDENDDEDRPAATSTSSTAATTAGTGSAGGSVTVARDSGPVQAIPASRFLPQVPKSLGPLDCVPSRPRPLAENGRRQPFSLITPEVVEATTQCMLASSRQIENRRITTAKSSSSAAHLHTRPLLDGGGGGENKDDEDMEVEMEAAVIEELGRCFKQIINAANRTHVAGSAAPSLDPT